MKYLNRKETAYHAEIGDEVMFLADFGDIAVGVQGTVVEKGEEHVVVRVAPKTAYEQENASLRATVTVTDADMNVLAFGGDLQEYEPKPAPKVEAPAPTVEDENKDGDDDANKDVGGKDTAGATDGANAAGASTTGPQD